MICCCLVVSGRYDIRGVEAEWSADASSDW